MELKKGLFDDFLYDTPKKNKHCMIVFHVGNPGLNLGVILLSCQLVKVNIYIFKTLYQSEQLKNKKGDQEPPQFSISLPRAQFSSSLLPYIVFRQLGFQRAQVQAKLPSINFVYYFLLLLLLNTLNADNYTNLCHF